MTHRQYLVTRDGAGWIFTVGGYRSSLFGTAAMAADIALTAARKAHRSGDDTRVLMDRGDGEKILWRSGEAATSDPPPPSPPDVGQGRHH